VLIPLELIKGRLINAKCALYTNACPSSRNSFFSAMVEITVLEGEGKIFDILNFISWYK